MRKPRRKKNQKSERLIEQPIAEATATVPCKICGHGVDPSRMHFHMVRFHGAAIRAIKPPQS
jgi:hypothetical protein